MNIKRHSRLRMLMLSVAVFAPVAAGLFRVWVHQDVVRLGYALSAQETRSHNLRDELRKLRVELAAVRSPIRLNALAKRLDLGRPTPHRVLGFSADEGGQNGEP